MTERHGGGSAGDFAARDVSRVRYVWQPEIETEYGKCTPLFPNRSPVCCGGDAGGGGSGMPKRKKMTFNERTISAVNSSSVW